MKRISAIFTIFIFLASVFVSGYVSVPVLAVDTTTDWSNCSTAEEQAEAFRAYCKSRDLTIEGTVSDAVTSFTTQTYNKLVSVLGLNIDSIAYDVKKSIDSNTGLKYLYNSSGASVFARLFQQFLYDNELAVGDEILNQNLHSGLFYNGCFVYNVKQTGILKDDFFISLGSIYSPFTSQFLLNNIGTNYNVVPFINSDLSVDIICRNALNPNIKIISGKSYIYTSSNYNYDFSNFGYFVINGDLSKLYFGYLSRYTYNNELYSEVDNYLVSPDETISNANVYLTTNNKTINNNNYENNTYTVINNNGDVYNYDSEDEPSPDTPITPPGGTVPDWGTGDGIDFPKINLPDLNIDWKINGLTEKFPFSIPFDLVAFYTTLNAEPHAPVIDAHIPLGDFYDWHFVADFSQFDDKAQLIRTVEFIGFCIGLIYITIRLVRG